MTNKSFEFYFKINMILSDHEKHTLKINKKLRPKDTSPYGKTGCRKQINGKRLKLF